MEKANWLPLIEYSNKHNVSISTLRRRIKEKSIQFQLHDGKYYIIDDIIEKATKGRRPIPLSENTMTTNVGHEEFIAQKQTPNPVLDEIKKAYAASLYSKEELIFQLKEEVSDLKTLVRVLEAEVERLKSTSANLY